MDRGKGLEYRPTSSDDELTRRTNRGAGPDLWNPTEDETAPDVQTAKKKIEAFKKLGLEQIQNLRLEELQQYRTAAEIVQAHAPSDSPLKNSISKTIEQLDFEISQHETNNTLAA